jgi:hypothetical protein
VFNFVHTSWRVFPQIGDAQNEPKCDPLVHFPDRRDLLPNRIP